MASPRMLSEKQAWREVARRIAEGEWAHCGICNEVWELDAAGLISPERAERMEKRAAVHASRSPHRMRFASVGGWFAYPMGSDADARILAALWMALESEDEAKSGVGLLCDARGDR